MNHTDKETKMFDQGASNIPSKNDKNTVDCEKIQKDQYEHWAQTMTFPSYVINDYKNKYPTTYAELRLDGLSKQQTARYIYHNCEIDNGRMFDMNNNDNGLFTRSGVRFVRYLSSN